MEHKKRHLSFILSFFLSLSTGGGGPLVNANTQSGEWKARPFNQMVGENSAAKRIESPFLVHHSTFRRAGDGITGSAVRTARPISFALPDSLKTLPASSTNSAASARHTECRNEACSRAMQKHRTSEKASTAFGGIWRLVLLVAVDLDGTVILKELPDGFPASPPVICGDSTEALLSACRGRNGVDNEWFDLKEQEAIRIYTDGYKAIMDKYTGNDAGENDPETRMKRLVAEMDIYENQMASTPHSRMLLKGIDFSKLLTDAALLLLCSLEYSDYIDVVCSSPP